MPKNLKNQLFDFGEVAESLLFFENVNLYLKDLNLETLFRTIPVDYLLSLINDHGLKLFYTYNHLKIYERPKGQNTQIGLGFVTSKIDKSQIIENILKHYYSNHRGLSRVIQEFTDKIVTYNHPPNITNEVLNDFLLEDYTRFGLEQTISNKEVLKLLDIKFFRDDEKSYLYRCNYKNRLQITDQNGKPVEMSDILDPFVHAHEQLLLASQEESSISTYPLVSKLMSFKANSLIKNHLNEDNIELFKDTFIPDFHNISSSINDNPQKLKEFLNVLEKSKPLRTWLQESNQDTNLVREFYKKSTEKTWIEKLPSKGTRFLIFTGSGLLLDAILTGGIGTAVGIALSAGDTFLLDRLLSKWSPNFQINQSIGIINSFKKK